MRFLVMAPSLVGKAILTAWGAILFLRKMAWSSQSGAA